MKRSLLLAVILTFFLVSCSYVDNKPPYGVWQSVNPNIVMFVDPTIGDPESGLGQNYHVIYTQEDGVTKDLSVIFYKYNYMMDIGQRYIVQSEKNGEIIEGVKVYSYFIGNYKKADDTLTVSLTSQPMAGTNYDVIVFKKIQDYEEVTE